MARKPIDMDITANNSMEARAGRTGGIEKTTPGKGGGSNMKANMGTARRTLEAQTERGKYVPEVGGHKVHTHSGMNK